MEVIVLLDPNSLEYEDFCGQSKSHTIALHFQSDDVSYPRNMLLKNAEVTEI